MDHAMVIAVVLIDSLRPDHLGCYGYRKQTSPNIDRIAQGALLFENAFSQSNWTYPSVYSIISGRYPSGLNLSWFNQKIHDDFKTFPDVLAENGFNTAVFASFEFLANPGGFGSHFQSQSHLQLDDKTLPQLMDWVKNNKKSFLFWHIGEYVHEPFFADKKDVNAFLDKDILDYDPHPAVKALTSPLDGPTQSEGEISTLRTIIGDINNRFVNLGPKDIAYMLACYDAGIHKVDSIIGQFHAQLQERLKNENEEYLFFLIADHGQGFLEHGIFGHGQGLYDEMIRVPMIVDYSGKYIGTISQMSELLDISPTIMEIAGLDGAFRQDGHSLLTEKIRIANFQKTEIISEGYPLICIRDEHHKLITSYFSFMKTGDICRKLCDKSKTKSNLRNLKACVMWDKLFDISNDAKEEGNLRWKKRDVHKRLKDRLIRFMETSGTTNLMPSEVSLEAELLSKRLRDLGYL
jgi:arylsulfatase A-like enzyme